MILNEIATQMGSYCKIVKLFENMYAKISISLGSDTVLNYRAALSHYEKCYEAYNKENKENKEFIQQEANLYEHLTRGLKDATLLLTYGYCYIIFDMMNNNTNRNTNSYLRDFSVSKKSILRKHLHGFKNFALDVRKSSISTKEILNDTKMNLENLTRLIGDFDILMKENGILFKIHYETAENALKKRTRKKNNFLEKE